MKAPAVVDEVLPEFDHEQLVLDREAFEALGTFAELGAITPVSFLPATLGRDLTYDEYELLAGAFGAVNRSCQWWIGDLLNAAENVHGETYAQIAFRTGLNEQTLLNRKYVCAHVPPDRRKPSLAFSLHADVAPLSAREQNYWLNRAVKGNWTRDVFREHLRAKRKTEKPTIPVDGDAGPEPGSLMEVGYAILRDAREIADGVKLVTGDWVIPGEDIARLRAALGEEDE